MLMNEKIEEINKEKEKFEEMKKSEVASDVLLKVCFITHYTTLSCTLF